MTPDASPNGPMANIAAADSSPLGMTLDAWFASLQARGFRYWIPENRNVFKCDPWPNLKDADREFIRANREAIKEYVRSGREPAQSALRTAPEAKAVPRAALPEPEAEPEVFVGRRRVTDADVCQALEALGDDALADYTSGRLSKHEAYAMTARGLLQQLALRAERPLLVETDR